MIKLLLFLSFFVIMYGMYLKSEAPAVHYVPATPEVSRDPPVRQAARRFT